VSADPVAEPATGSDPTAGVARETARAAAPSLGDPPPRPSAPGGEDSTVEYAVVQFDAGPERPVASVVAGFCDVHAADEHAAENGYGDYVVAPARMVRPA
jgi:hypothetical protein